MHLGSASLGLASLPRPLVYISKRHRSASASLNGIPSKIHKIYRNAFQ
jgi:hypothetical protein